MIPANLPSPPPAKPVNDIDAARIAALTATREAVRINEERRK